jgi:hypothetical protein
MRPLLLILVLAFALSAGPLLFADESQIDPGDALNHVRENVTVSGLVVAVFVSKHGNAFINFGDKYPQPDLHRLDPGRHATGERSVVTGTRVKRLRLPA